MSVSTVNPQTGLANITVDEIEAKLFLEGLRMKYGYDFSDYAEASILRRVEAVLRQFRFKSPLEAIDRCLKDPMLFQQVLAHMTVTTSEMFRDPEFFALLRKEVVPVLRTYPQISVWSAGCSTGEEVYSLAILFEEEGISDRTVIYATDINPKAIKAAQDGIYRAEDIKVSTRNYQEAGGKESFSQYYTADYGLAKMNSDLLRNVVFYEHNLATEDAFIECQLILCRNVMIYFNKNLQERAVDVFARSLRYGGYLCIGSKESIQFMPAAKMFEKTDDKWRIYRKNTFENSGRRGSNG